MIFKNKYKCLLTTLIILYFGFKCEQSFLNNNFFDLQQNRGTELIFNFCTTFPVDNIPLQKEREKKETMP